MYPDPHCSCFGYLRKTLVRAESVTKEATERRNASCLPHIHHLHLNIIERNTRFRTDTPRIGDTGLTMRLSSTMNIARRFKNPRALPSLDLLQRYVCFILVPGVTNQTGIYIDLLVTNDVGQIQYGFIIQKNISQRYLWYKWADKQIKNLTKSILKQTQEEWLGN